MKIYWRVKCLLDTLYFNEHSATRTESTHSWKLIPGVLFIFNRTLLPRNWSASIPNPNWWSAQQVPAFNVRGMDFELPTISLDMRINSELSTRTSRAERGQQLQLLVVNDWMNGQWTYQIHVMRCDRAEWVTEEVSRNYSLALIDWQ